MTAASIFEKFKQLEPEFAPKITAYKLSKNKGGNSIFMRDAKGSPYVFTYKSDDDWAFFGGSMALDYERG